MSDTVYAIASGKGGVGKTTTAINLGAMLADRGHAVVVVDADLGMANLAGFLDFDIETPTLHEVLAGEATADEAVYEAPGGIDVLPSATDIEAFAKSNPANLRSVVGPLREKYDYVLLDTGAGVSYDTLVPLALADATVLVATPDVASVRDTAKTGELSERVGTEVVGAVLTQRASNILNADDVESTLGTDVLAVVPSDEAVPMGVDAGRPLAAFAPNAPAGQAYRDLAAVLTGDAEPDPELGLDDAAADDADDGGAEVTPETLTEGVERDPEEPLEDVEIAENVRDAIDSGDDAEGLLGGELAKAADEIRREAASDPPVDSGDGDELDDDGPNADDEPDAEAPDAGPDEARSVDDLIEEHLGDDRLDGESESLDAAMAEATGDDTDDPLAGDQETDPLGGARDRSRTDSTAVPGGGSGADGGDSERLDDRDAAPVDADSDAVPFTRDRSDAEASTDERSDATADRDAASNDAEERSDPSDESEGVLGRLGSLFR